MVEIEGRRYYTTVEVAFELKKSPEQVRRWCREGYLDVKKIERNYFIAEEEAEALKAYFERFSVLRKNWKELLRGVK